MSYQIISIHCVGDDGYGSNISLTYSRFKNGSGVFYVTNDTFYPPPVDDSVLRRSAPSASYTASTFEDGKRRVISLASRYATVTARVLHCNCDGSGSMTLVASGTIDEILREENLGIFHGAPSGLSV
jgi:hypothetical protein